MNSITHKGSTITSVLVCLVIICVLFLGNKVFGEAKKLNLRNATDSLMLLIELATEAGDDYANAKTVHAKLLRDYVGHMEQRDLHWLLRLPPFSKKNVAKVLKRVAEDLEKADQLNAREEIKSASETIAQFLTESKPFTSEPISTFEPEVISEEIRDVLKESLIGSHEKVERYANANESLTVDDAKAACMANRRAIVYLYLARFGYQEIVNQEELKTFRTDINRTIYYNRVLQESDTVKGSEEEECSDYWRLTRYSDSELRRLRLLQAIIDNDIQQAQVLLQIAIKKAIPDI